MRNVVVYTPEDYTFNMTVKIKDHIRIDENTGTLIVYAIKGEYIFAPGHWARVISVPGEEA